MKFKHLFFSTLSVLAVISALGFNIKNEVKNDSAKEVKISNKNESPNFLVGVSNNRKSIIFPSPDSEQQNGGVVIKNVYKNYFPIGAAADFEPGSFLTESKGRDFIASQFSSITPENSMKMKRIQPTEGNFRWTEADQTVDFAVKNHMKIRGHCLIWSAILPDWFLKDGFKTASKELVLKRMKDHITAVVNRYKGKVYCWDVVNEAVSRDSNAGIYKQDLLYKICGPEYIEKAFEYAHQADPNAILFYNDQGFEKKEKRDRIYTLVKGLKAKGIPVSGIGMQGHLTIDDDPEQILTENIKMFSGLGLQVQITELDVSIYKRGMTPSALVNVDDKYTVAIQNKQAAIFDEVFRVCRQNKDKVTGITLWVPADGLDYITRALKKKNYPSLFDEKMKPKMNFKRVTTF